MSQHPAWQTWCLLTFHPQKKKKLNKNRTNIFKDNLITLSNLTLDHPPDSSASPLPSVSHIQAQNTSWCRWHQSHRWRRWRAHAPLPPGRAPAPAWDHLPGTSGSTRSPQRAGRWLMSGWLRPWRAAFYLWINKSWWLVMAPDVKPHDGPLSHTHTFKPPPQVAPSH